MRVVGLDISLTNTGVAIWQDGVFAQSRKFGRKGKNDETIPQRRKRILTLADQVMEMTKPEFVALAFVEQPAYSQAGGSTWDRAGIWWEIIGGLVDKGVPIVQVAPNTLKLFATGGGGASKAEMITAALRRHPEANVIDDNTADATHLAALYEAAIHNPGAYPKYAVETAQRITADLAVRA